MFCGAGPWAMGAEPAAFWDALGGRKEYAQLAEGAAMPQDPRLFQVCDAAAGGVGVACEAGPRGPRLRFIPPNTYHHSV